MTFCSKSYGYLYVTSAFDDCCFLLERRSACTQERTPRTLICAGNVDEFANFGPDLVVCPIICVEGKTSLVHMSDTKAEGNTLFSPTDLFFFPPILFCRSVHCSKKMETDLSKYGLCIGYQTAYSGSLQQLNFYKLLITERCRFFRGT